MPIKLIMSYFKDTFFPYEEHILKTVSEWVVFKKLSETYKLCMYLKF